MIDSESIRGPSRAENASRLAKEEVSQRLEQFGAPAPVILGINEEVVMKVGHELGTFATSEEIQSCGIYVRLQAA